MKKYLLIAIPAILLPLNLFAFSIFGDPVKMPVQHEYYIHGHSLGNENLPNTANSDVDTTLLVLGISTQSVKSTSMFYVGNYQLHQFKNSSWALPISRMLAVATFETILESNIVSNLALQNINVKHDYTLFGTTAYGPILNKDQHTFFFYITYYLKNEHTKKNVVKTFKFHENIKSSDLNAQSYATLSNKAMNQILTNMQPWLINQLQSQNMLAKQKLDRKKLLEKTRQQADDSTKDSTPYN